jgi:hypothetical protein
MVRHHVDHSAPEGVEAVRQIDETERLTYRDASVRRDGLTIRVDESRSPAPLRPFQIALVGLWSVGVPMAIALGVPQVLAFILAVTVVVPGLMARWDAERGGYRAPGFRGTFRFEDGWLRSESPERHDVTADLALVKNVHIIEADRGRELIAEMLDDEEIVLASEIANVEVARYVAKRIAEASNAAKAVAAENDGSR